MSLTEHAPPYLLPLGVQRPRILDLPPTFSSTAGDEFIHLADSAGLILDDWQRFDLRAMTLEMVDPASGALRWAAIENAEIPNMVDRIKPEPVTEQPSPPQNVDKLVPTDRRGLSPFGLTPAQRSELRRKHEKEAAAGGREPKPSKSVREIFGD